MLVGILSAARPNKVSSGQSERFVIRFIQDVIDLIGGMMKS